jgi:hypothetical protein
MKRRFSTDDENVPSNGINNLADTFIAETLESLILNTPKGPIHEK